MKRRNFLKQSLVAVGAGAFCRALNSENLIANAEALLSEPLVLRQALLEEAKRIFTFNRVDSKLGVFHLPSKASYPRFFGWDSGWNVISQSAFDPESALLELEAVFNFQDDSGYVAHEALIPEFDKSKDPTYLWLGDKYFDDKGRCRIVDPPSYLIAAEALYRKTKSQRVLALIPQMEKCLEYLLEQRDLFGDGLVSIIHPWEAGTDEAPYFDACLGINVNNPLTILKVGARLSQLISECDSQNWELKKIAEANKFIFEDLCINAITCAGAVSVAELIKAKGDEKKANFWMGKAKAMIEAMEKIFWDNERGFFFPRWDLKAPKRVYRTSVPGMLPLLTGLVSEDKAQRVIESYLVSPAHFWGKWLVPFNSITEMKQENTLWVRNMLWRGPCIWINMNWMSARVAARYGRKDLAKRITQNTALMVYQNGFREYYNPETGKGIGANNFTWPALVLDMIDEYGI